MIRVRNREWQLRWAAGHGAKEEGTKPGCANAADRDLAACDWGLTRVKATERPVEALGAADEPRFRSAPSLPARGAEPGPLRWLDGALLLDGARGDPRGAAWGTRVAVRRWRS